MVLQPVSCIMIAQKEAVHTPMESNIERFWHLELYSGEIIKVRPDAQKITYIQNLIARQEGAITTPTRSIVVKDIKDFRLSDEVYSDQKLIENAAQLFNEPILTPEGGIESTWVKKSVPRRRWDTFYRFNPSYKILRDEESTMVIAFVIPTHQKDLNTQNLTYQEEQQIQRIVS